ncbi:hypothetical protein [Staphylococcus aureus]|nr:hypothetical protein [Staphylococcus aureus]MDU0483716.1 hypothetical protein [Staphylococcus aureus]
MYFKNSSLNYIPTTFGGEPQYRRWGNWDIKIF